MGRRFLIALICGICSLAISARAATENLESRAKQVGELFGNPAPEFDSIFAPVFLNAVPPTKLALLLGDLTSQLGKCTTTRLMNRASDSSGDFQFEFEKGFVADVKLAIDPAPPNKVTGFFIGAPAPAVQSLDALIDEFKKLPGTSSLLVAGIKGPNVAPIAALNSDAPLAIGSTFKLYVLAELVRQIKAGEHHWEDVVTLSPQGRSLPSGVLQDWPAQSPITIHTLASLMISQSDNTATDQLILLLGREKIEAMLATAGNQMPAKSIPFLTTLEMFKLKANSSDGIRKDYLAANVEERRRLLKGLVAAIPRESISLPATPSHIDEIEWFASAADLARVMYYLHINEDSQAKEILSINPGVGSLRGNWKYIGFKGGSEAGVLNLTILLQSNAGDWYVVSATQNDLEKVIDETKFVGLVSRAAALLKTEIEKRP